MAALHVERRRSGVRTEGHYGDALRRLPPRFDTLSGRTPYVCFSMRTHGCSEDRSATHCCSHQEWIALFLGRPSVSVVLEPWRALASVLLFIIGIMHCLNILKKS